jgi:hypothetical protein
MERVVYILGAGFSAPLGLPVMRNFRHMSQDMYFFDTARYNYFLDVFNTIGGMSLMKNFFNADLYNIEEVLSILEMGEFLTGGKLKVEFISYLADVINYYTPELHSDMGNPAWHKDDWAAELFGAGGKPAWLPYGYFFSNILNVQLIAPTGQSVRLELDLECEPHPAPECRYSIITLNYDMIPEKVSQYLNGYCDVKGGPVQFLGPQPLANLYPTPNRFMAPRLAKLHGSVHDGSIIPPTWNKGSDAGIAPVWDLARSLLADATQIRILGYSLPITDTYVKYLLKAAVSGGVPFLKQIDVICRDRDGSVKARYDDFITFSYYSFKSADIMDYLTAHVGLYPFDNARPYLIFELLETAHQKFMRGS